MARLSTERLSELSTEAVRAGLTADIGALVAVLEVLMVEGDADDALGWTLKMIGTATAGTPRRADLPADQRDKMVAVPWVTITGDDGIERSVSIDDVPLGVATYARLCTAWIADDTDQAVSVWAAMIMSDTDGLPETGRCMNMALNGAVAATRRAIGKLQ
jgi:hypothetical protein